MYFGNGLFDYLWNFFVCYGSKLGNHFAHNLREFRVACSEKLEVNQWIALDIRRLSSQSERARKTLSTVLIYTTWCFNGVKTQQLVLERGFVKQRLNSVYLAHCFSILLRKTLFVKVLYETESFSQIFLIMKRSWYFFQYILIDGK